MKGALAMRLYGIRAFTLVEVLVVISIISMIMAILVPCLGYARERAKRVACMANLRSIGQGIYVYANDNDGRLIPGDHGITWTVWGNPTERSVPGGLCCDHVNLGYLLASNILPVPTNKDSVFFCPSGFTLFNEQTSECFRQYWGIENLRASVTYMFNEALDGFQNGVHDGEHAVLSHRDKINFLRGDGSVQTFKVKPLVFDEAVGPELLQEVTARYEVCFPTIMLHEWLEQGEVDLAQAKEYLSDPSGWMDLNCTQPPPKSVLLSNVGNKSLVCDVVGYPTCGVKYG
jgi:prepilin-type N-terminal cleavage/methylation domain-containing protein